MREESKIAVVIPALNEQESIGKVLRDVPDWVDDIVVVDNGSTDDTVKNAEASGARVAVETRRGYGSACLAGIAALDPQGIVVFLDGDYSDHPDEMEHLVDPIARGDVEMVIGSRVREYRERGALTPQARFGNWLSCGLMRLLWGARYTDLGPFRAIRYSALEYIDMQDRNFGWTIEMQIKAFEYGLRTRDVPVSYRKRIGKSKISGTLKGVIGAGTKILSTVFAHWIRRQFSRGRRRQRRNRLVIFSRFPEPGKTKTRLIPALGAEGAAEFQRQMTEHMINTAEIFRTFNPATIEVRHTSANEQEMLNWLGFGLEYRFQGDRDLGERMHQAFISAFQEGARRVVLIGTDCPGISVSTLHEAFLNLKRHDLVLGPANDGGYYLIAMNRSCPRLFAGISWGSGSVLRETLAIAEEENLSIHLLPPLDDVDRAEDLASWERARENSCSPMISVIVPTLNEAENIESALDSARRGNNIEIIVVDADSKDSTVQKAESVGATVLSFHANRARQMNVGASRASGEILLFLHADTRLPERFDSCIRHVMANRKTLAGAFMLRIDAPAPGLRIIELLANWRSRLRNMPYGDQGIFVRADAFHVVGGFPDQALMEDFAFMSRIRRRGRVDVVPSAIKTSARRWTRLGTLRTTLLNQIILVAYALGVSPRRLARWYGRECMRAGNITDKGQASEREAQESKNNVECG
ncbi:TIGR04283 family arsenosugar biosynthesis glycosyltransferase [Candidatus Hydrogenedentota bacterium]